MKLINENYKETWYLFVCKHILLQHFMLYFKKAVEFLKMLYDVRFTRL